MSRLFRRVVIFLVFVIAVLQIIHISLMSRLDKKRKENEQLGIGSESSVGSIDEKDTNFSTPDDKYEMKHVDDDRKRMYQSLQSLSSVLDSSGEYRLLSLISTSDILKSSHWKYSILDKIGKLDENGISGAQLQKRNDVAIVSHGTVYQLHNVPLLSRRWHGLISIAVLVVSIQQLPLAIETILLLRFCNPAIRHRVNFHLVYPLSLSGKISNQQARSVLDFLRWPDIIETYPELDQIVDKRHCAIARTRSLLKRLTDANNYAHKVPYPNNLLRNIGRRYALTEFTFVIDIDLVPSAHLYERFLEFGRRSKLFKQWDTMIEDVHSTLSSEKIILVVPTYEIDLNLTATLRRKTTIDDEDELIPRDKEDLIVGIEQQIVRPFYIELCWKCQKYTDYDAWLHASMLINSTKEHRIDILFEVLWHDPWEPFYISANNAPLYDERFRQYGFNRISQVCELHMAGYKFAVLNNAFLVHKGFKTPGNFHADKDIELERNRMLFRQFKLQLKDRYPTSNRRC